MAQNEIHPVCKQYVTSRSVTYINEEVWESIPSSKILKINMKVTNGPVFYSYHIVVLFKTHNRFLTTPLRFYIRLSVPHKNSYHCVYIFTFCLKRNFVLQKLMSCVGKNPRRILLMLQSFNIEHMWTLS